MGCVDESITGAILEKSIVKFLKTLLPYLLHWVPEELIQLWVLKEKRLFEGGAISREAPSKYIKSTSK